ncbi:hypothetical protein BDF22DRAFT_18647 [Syncephalis plumigaleata]|nr:hypothetical protein BDF22DRAFT_18647 [Syncephalis plumigaleata]
MSTIAKQSHRHRSGGGPRQEEPDNIRSLRRLYGRELGTLREMFVEWTDEDLLQVLQETDGQLDTAAMRISTGQASQWGQVKSKKTKKDEYQRSSTSAASRGTTGSNQLSSGFQASLAAATAAQQQQSYSHSSPASTTTTTTTTTAPTSSHTFNNHASNAGTNSNYGTRYQSGTNHPSSNQHSHRGGSSTSGRGRGGKHE